VSPGGYVAVLTVELHIPSAGSLKGKRRELKSLRDGLRVRFGASVSETGYQDLWQRSELTVALSGATVAHLREQVQSVERWLERHPGVDPRVSRTLLSVSELHDLAGVAGAE
jgi:uncharacterized protein YlxP (DUF503 family)